MRNTKFMNKIKKIFSFILLTGFAFSTNAQGSVTASVAVSAKIIATISIDGVQGMSFGDLTNDGGTVVLSTDGNITDDGTRAVGGTITAGGFTVNGGINEAFRLKITATALTNQTGSGAETMALSAIQVSQEGAADKAMVVAGLALTLDSADEDFTIGASLTIGTSQAAGAYTGTMSVVAAYE
jgi:hypothetical protein